MTKWGELIARFQKLAKKTGADKSTSYEVKIWVDLNEGWRIDLGTYDVGDWPRHTEMDFDDEAAALKWFEEKIIEAEKAVDESLFDDLVYEDELEDYQRNIIEPGLEGETDAL